MQDMEPNRMDTPRQAHIQQTLDWLAWMEEDRDAFRAFRSGRPDLFDGLYDRTLREMDTAIAAHYDRLERLKGWSGQGVCPHG